MLPRQIVNSLIILTAISFPILSHCEEINEITSKKQQDILDSTKELDRLEGLIRKQQEEYQKKPKRKFVGTRIKDYRYALYVKSWEEKIEKVGNLNYPQVAKDFKLYGSLQMTVSIKSDGSIESIELHRSSGHRELDEAARHIVELAAPFNEFSDDMRKDVDILSITRTWTFAKDSRINY